MPLNNNFYGVYKFATVKTIPYPLSAAARALYPYVIKSLDVNDGMAVQPKFYMQGTPLTKVLDIGNASQEISIKAPVLVAVNPDLAIIDGLRLLWDLANSQYTNGLPNNFLPAMTSAKITISNDTNVDITLKSDGDPNNTINVFQITSGALAQSYIDSTNLVNGSRVAKNYDFFINLGGLCYFIENATVDIKINTDDKSFLGQYQGSNLPANYTVPTDGLNEGVYQNDASYSGWQFPFIAVGGIEITASGTAVVSINENGEYINYENIDAVQTNINDLLAASNVTLQYSGELTTTVNNFNIFYSGANAPYSGVLPPIFAVNKAVISQRNTSFNNDIMTTNFTVKAYVGL